MEEGNIVHETGQAMHVPRNTEARSCKPFLKVEKQYILRILSVCSFGYAAFNARTPYIRLWSYGCKIFFPRYLINCTIFEKRKIIEHKMCV